MNADMKNVWDRIAPETPDPLGALMGLERLRSDLGEPYLERFAKNPKAAKRLAWFLAASPGLIPFLIRHPLLAVSLYLEDGVAQLELEYARLNAFIEDCRQAEDIDELTRRVARFRNSQIVRHYSQEILGLFPPQEVWRGWTRAASWCVHGAVEGCRSLIPQAVDEKLKLVVMGMGKMGAGELNFASDIDLIYLYSPTGKTHPSEIHDAAVQWARRVTTVLETNTEVGPAFRVDLGLRPGGKDGEMALTPRCG